MTPEELFSEWAAAWITRDSDEKVRRLRDCCTDNVEFIPPDSRPVFRGFQQLADHVAEYTAAWPEGVRLELVQPPDTHHDWSRALVRWIFPNATAVATDLIRIEDGKIATMLVFAEEPLQS